MNKFNVLITEDHALIRFGLKTAMSSMEMVAEIFEAPDSQTATSRTP